MTDKEPNVLPFTGSTAAVPKEPTHRVIAFKRIGKKWGRWFEVGTSRLDADGRMHFALELTPFGGWTGYLIFNPLDAPNPEPPMPEPPADYAEQEFNALYRVEGD